MPTTPPVPPAARTPYGPEGVMKDHADVTHRVRHAAERLERDERSAAQPDFDELGPLLKLAGAALAGYVIGALIHRRS